MNFNEYDFGSDLDLHKRVDHSGPLPPDDGMGAVAHDLMAFKKLAGKVNLGCVDSSCCADGTMYDDVKKRCIPSMKKHEENTHKASLSKGAMSSAQRRWLSILVLMLIHFQKTLFRFRLFNFNLKNM